MFIYREGISSFIGSPGGIKERGLVDELYVHHRYATESTSNAFEEAVFDKAKERDRLAQEREDIIEENRKQQNRSKEL